jgi:hypothetical protein
MYDAAKIRIKFGATKEIFLFFVNRCCGMAIFAYFCSEKL